ncbi:DUF4232 domain-containing protein [Streptomyces sp. NPDC002125]
MLNRRLRTALLVTAAVTAGFLTTACGAGSTGTDSTAASDAGASGTPTASPSGSPKTSAGADDDGAAKPAAASKDKAPAAGSGAGSGSGSGADSGTSEAADKTGYGQSCGTNDLVWGAKERSQAGGYYRISVKAKAGITCALPGGLPVIAFGSGGTQAGPAEQVAGEEITLSGGTTAYAGVSPKTTPDDGGTEYSTVIVSVTEADPNPVSLKVGSVLVDAPIVTNWHTDPQAAVPFTS